MPHERQQLARRTSTLYDPVVCGAKLDLYTGAGGFICRLVEVSIAQPGIYRARVVNNTDVPQPLAVAPFTDFRNIGWNLGVAVEP